MDALFQLSHFFLKTYNQPYQRYLLKRHPFTNRFSIIVGPRGAGKTTLIIQYLASWTKNYLRSSEILYVPVDHFSVGKQPIYEIAENFYNHGGKLIVFDEIHKYSNWSIELKSIYDRFPELKMIASGSSALEIWKGSHDLARRAIVYTLHGLSFREYIDLMHNTKTQPISLENLVANHESLAEEYTSNCEKHHHKVLIHFKNYLKIGFFPYFREYQNPEQYYITLEQMIHTTLESDLLSIYPTLNGSSIKKIKKLLSIIAASVPFTPDLKHLKKLIDVADERTLKNYLFYLEKACLINALYKHGKGLREMEKPEKIYLNNPNQVYAILADGKQNIGNIRETFFINMLSVDHEITASKKGDFLINDQYTFEVGGKNKGFKQIKGVKQSYLAIDNIEIGIRQKIPLWLFGFLY
ncbi:AAA ATPase [Candidatus Magnetomorum sp. HK-1]|nr:AAA ATPase [Candidatus Magnetomorum sp. HK-1]